MLVVVMYDIALESYIISCRYITDIILSVGVTVGA